MPEPENNPGDNAPAPDAQLTEIENKLKERGFDSVDALLSDRDTIAEERDGFKGQNENAQKIIQKQGSELGVLRKGDTDSNSDNGEKPDGEPASKKDEDSLEEIEQSLTDEQKAAADVVFAKLSDEDKIEFTSNPEARIEFLKAAREAVASVPKTLWDKPLAKAVNKTDSEKIKSLFEGFKQQSTYVPTGSNTVQSRGLPDQGEQKAKTHTRIGSGGVVEAIDAKKETAGVA